MKKKAGKRLSFLVTLALSAGLGTTVQPPSACAAEINVTTDRTADVDGGAADGNKVTIGAEGGGKHPRIEGNIIGGSAADAAKNLVDIKSVLLESPHAVYGGRGTDSASENTVNFAGGKVTSIYGGYTEGTGAVTKNTVQVTGGTLDGDVYGGKAEGTGAAQNNHVTVRLADTTHQINGLIVGGTATASTSAITGNSVSFEGGYIDIGGAAVGGFADASHTGDLKNNTFTLKGGEVSMGMGALAREGSGTVGGDSAADGNHAIVEGGKAYYGVCGGMAMGAGKVSYNTTTISGGEVETAAIGGWHNFSDGNDTAIIRRNSVTITGGSVKGFVHGGISDGAGTVTENTVTITGGTLAANDDGSCTQVYGGYVRGNGKAMGNIVNLGNASHDRLAAGTNLEHAILYGGNKTDDVTGNTLNVYAKNAVVNSVKNFDKYVFHLKGDAASDAPMLTLKAADGFGALVDWDKLSLDTANAANTQTIGKATLLKSETANALKFKNYAAKSQTSGDYETTLRTDTNAGTASSVLLDYNRFQNNTAVYDGTKAATPLAGGTSEIYGGISYKGNTAANNRLTINGLPSGGVTAAYGGKATNGAGGATGNRVTVSATGEEKIGSVYGGYTSGTGAVTDNTVTFSGGATLHDLMGGHIDNAASHANATGNTVTITGGSIGGSVYGGYTSGTGKTTGNTVRFTDGTVTGTIYGGSDAKDVKENTLVVSGKRTAGQIANFEKLHFDAGMAKANDMLLTLKGGAATAGLDWQKLETTGLDENRLKTLTSPFTEKLFSLMENAKGLDFGTTYDKAKEKTVGDYEYTIDTDTKGAAAQKVVVRGFQFQNNGDAKYETGDNKAAWGGRSLIGNTVQRNKLTVTGGTLESAYGGLNAKGNVTNNTLVLAGGTVKNAYGGFAESTGNATANIVDVRKDTQAAICGGHAAQGEASDNILYLGGVTIDADVCGGFGKKTEGNIINLWGTKIHGTVTGGTAPVASGGKANILAIRSAGTEIHDFTGVQNLKFYLPEGATSSMATMLKLGVKDKDIRGLHVDVDFSGAAKRLQQNETFSLMKLAEGGTLTTDEKIAGEITGTQGVSLDYKFSVRKKNTDEIIAAVEETSLKNETKSLVETRAAATDVLGGGMSLLADAGIASAVTAAAANVQTGAYTSWAAQGGSSMRVHSGSYVDTHGYTLNVGFARKQTTKDGVLTFGPFVEYGRASYDSYLEDAAATHGDGKVSYVGAGLLARQDWKSGFYLEGSVRGGRIKSDYAGIIAKKATSYDISNPYYAIHLGMGKERKLRAGDSLETYLKYFYSHQSGASAKLSTGEDYNFDAVNSHRLRLGARYAHDMGENGRFYAGLAWDYEFEGEARATYQGMTTPSPSLKGASAMLELGYRFAPKDSRVSYDLNVSGWQGKREGFTASVGMNWTF